MTEGDKVTKLTDEQLQIRIAGILDAIETGGIEHEVRYFVEKQYVYWLPHSVSMDPNMIRIVSDAQRAILRKTGIKPNKIEMDSETYDEIILHPEVMDVIKYAGRGVSTKALLAELFIVEKIKVIEKAEAEMALA